MVATVCVPYRRIKTGQVYHDSFDISTGSFSDPRKLFLSFPPIRQLFYLFTTNPPNRPRASQFLSGEHSTNPLPSVLRVPLPSTTTRYPPASINDSLAFPLSRYGRQGPHHSSLFLSPLYRVPHRTPVFSSNPLHDLLSHHFGTFPRNSAFPQIRYRRYLRRRHWYSSRVVGFG